MHLKGDLCVAALLGISSLSFAAPSPAQNRLAARADNATAATESEAPLPPELKPEPEDDHITPEDPGDDIVDVKIDPGDLSDLPDYDPEQEEDDPSSKSKRQAPPKTSVTNLLREIRPGGKRLRPRFKAQANPKYVFVKPPSDGLDKTKPVGLKEGKTPFKIPKGEKEWDVWQADHVADLGLFTTLARRKKPSGIKDAPWQLYTTAVLGDDNKGEKANKRTSTLGKILNDEVSARGIFKSWNDLKMEIMNAAYAEKNIDTKAVLKKYPRSVAWGVYKMMIQTEDQFKGTIRKAATAAKGFVTDDDDSAKNLESTINTEMSKMREAAIKILEVALTKEPPKDVKDSPFLEDDCNNTKDSPNDVSGSATSPSSGKCTNGGFAVTQSDCEKNCAGGTCSQFQVQNPTSVTTYYGCKCP